MAIVIFNYDKFIRDYPNFSNITIDQFNFLSDLATLYLENKDCSIVDDVTIRERLLYLLIAHLAMIFYGDNKQNSGTTGAGTGTDLVGRINSAQEGSVSVSTDIGNMPFNAEFFMQTKYGNLFFQLTKPYRTATYYAGCDYF